MSAQQSSYSLDERALIIWRRLQIKEGWLSVFLLITIMMSTVWSVEASGWVVKLPSLGWIALGALSFGFVFAKLHIRGLILHPVAFIYGCVVVVWQTMSVIALPTWEDRFVDLVLRLNAWGYAARTGGINNDGLVFVFTLVCLTWLIGYLSAWFVFRSHHIWWGVVPSGVAIMTNLRYAPPHVALWFAVFLFSSMLLFIRLSFYLQENDWDRSQVNYSRQMSLSYLPTAILICCAILIAAWITPASAASSFASEAWHNVSGPWQDFQADFNRLFASLTSSVEDSGSSFGRAMILKGPVSLSARTTMLVTSDEPHYWRATSYDTYVGRGWVNAERSEIPYRANYAVSNGKQYQQRKEITQTVSVRIPKNDLILAASQPLRVSLYSMAEASRVPVFTIDLTDRSQDRGLPVEIRRNAERIRRSVELAKIDGTLGEAPWPTGFITELPPDVEVVRLVGKDATTVTGVELMRATPYPIDIVSLRAPQHLKKGQEYTVVSSVTTANEKQLKTAGTNYPGWVTERYLQVPTNFPARVADLATSLTGEAANPYDKVIAVQNYLRTIHYNQNIDAPPATVDPIEYFLFTSREGYCDYYASAMVMLLRTQGIPARIATGYLTGAYDTGNSYYVVKESNAHAWPEVFFPNYGWIEFEPTASVSPIVRPADDETAAPETPEGRGGLDEGEIPDEPFPGDMGLEGNGVAQSGSSTASLAAGAGALIAIGTILAVLWLIWQRGLTTLALPSQIYEKMCQLASLSRNGPSPSQTPYEYSDFLGKTIPENSADVARIAEAYTSMRFGRKEKGGRDSGGIERAWHRVRTRLIRLIVLRR